MGLDFWLYPKGEKGNNIVDISGYSRYSEICQIIEIQSNAIDMDLSTSYYTKERLLFAIFELIKMNTVDSIEVAKNILNVISKYNENQIFESYCSR
jgi:hypothetical protein